MSQITTVKEIRKQTFRVLTPRQRILKISGKYINMNGVNGERAERKIENSHVLHITSYFGFSRHCKEHLEWLRNLPKCLNAHVGMCSHIVIPFCRFRRRRLFFCSLLKDLSPECL